MNNLEKLEKEFAVIPHDGYLDLWKIKPLLTEQPKLWSDVLLMDDCMYVVCRKSNKPAMLALLCKVVPEHAVFVDECNYDLLAYKEQTYVTMIEALTADDVVLCVGHY